MSHVHSVYMFNFKRDR